MNVKDLILSEIPAAETEETSPKKRKAPTGPEWEIVLQDACDGAIRRKTAKTSKLLVLLMSQGQFYIKDEVANTIEELDADNLHRFLAGAGNLWLDPVPWSTSFTSKMKDAERFCKIIHNENFQWLARRGMHKFSYSRYDYDDDPYKLEQEVNLHKDPLKKLVEQVCKDAVGEEHFALVSSHGSELEQKVYNLTNASNQRVIKDRLEKIRETYGLDLTRAYIRAFLAAPFVGTMLPDFDNYRCANFFDDNTFEFKRFIEYIFCDSVRQGYGKVGSRYYSADLDDFIQMWHDTLRMQKQVYGKVKVKYPDDLDTMHRRLSFRVRMMEIYVDPDAFAKHTERLAKLVKKDGKYIIRPPYNKDDILDEAQQQANCLASYIDAYANNVCDLFFLRSIDDVNKSLVTVEVRNGRIRQAYAACNRRPSDEEVKWLNKWAKENNILPIDVDKQEPCYA